MRIFCPLVLGNSFQDFTRIALLFPNFNFKNVLILICVYAFYFAFITDGLFYWAIDTHFLLLPRQSLGPFYNEIHVMCGVVVCELVLIRSYCISMKIRHGRDSIGWFNIVSQVTMADHPMLFRVLKCLFFQVWAGGTLVYASNHLSKLLLERSTPLDYLVNAAWLVAEVVLLRITIVELPLHMVMACASYVNLNLQMNQLLLRFQQLHLGVDALVKYIALVRSIARVHPFMKLVSFTNGVSVLPYISLYIVVAITETENYMQLLIKCTYLVTASVYSVRGLVMTAVLSVIDSKSRVLYKSIASRIARGFFSDTISHRQLITIMDDLASRRNHICIREFSGSPCDQIDLLSNLVSIAQFVMLLKEFTAQLGF